MEVESGEPKIKDPPVVFSKKCEHGRVGEWFSWFGRLFFDFSNWRCVGELVVFSSLFRLALIEMISAFENPYRKTTLLLNLVVFSEYTQMSFSFQMENPEILSQESNESPRNVTIQRIMSQEFQATEGRWHCS